MNVDLWSVQPLGLVIIAASDLDAGVAASQRLYLQLQLEVGILIVRHQPDVVVLAPPRHVGRDRAIRDFPIHLVPIPRHTFHVPAFERLSIKERNRILGREGNRAEQEGRSTTNRNQSLHS